MEQNMKKPKHEMISKWYKFYFFEDCFECHYKYMPKKVRTIAYKDIIDISFLIVRPAYSFVPSYVYKLILDGQPDMIIVACNKKQRAALVPAMECVKEYRANFVMKMANSQ